MRTNTVEIGNVQNRTKSYIPDIQLECHLIEPDHQQSQCGVLEGLPP